MHMQYVFRPSSLTCTALVCAASALMLPAQASTTVAEGVQPVAVAHASELGVDAWSDAIWKAAIGGDREQVDLLLAHLPAMDDAAYDQFRSHLNDWYVHQDEADEYAASRRAEAYAELEQAIADENHIESLRAAVEVQTLSDDFDAALRDPKLSAAIEAAKAKLPEIMQDRDWIYAQEVLMGLRTLYEDTSFRATYQDYEEQMEANGKRIILLRRYARQKLYDLFVKRNGRLGKPAPSEFNESLSDRWMQEVAHIDRAMVADALHTSASEHIADSGWIPLYDGGFDSLEVLTATPAMQSTFPLLGDEDELREWQDGLAELQKDVAGQLDAGRSPYRVNSWCFSALELLNEETVNLPENVMWREFADGALDSLDPYTSIIWPYDITEFNRQMQGKFIGVGIMISEDEVGDIKVVYPLEGKPAYHAGVQPDARIVEVDGQSTAGWTVQDAVHFITGPQHTSVTLGIEREGTEEMLDIPVTRDVIKMHSVKGWKKVSRDEEGDPVWDWFVDPVSRIGYVKLTQFSEDTYFDLRSAIAQMHEGGKPSGLVLDLRFNPGGLLSSAHQISDLFVSEGRILSGENKDGNLTFSLDAHRHNTVLGDLPTVVLINQGSASASEIVSGCIQAHEVGVVIGERSFGKGSVQTVHDVANSAKLKCTTQYYRLPEGLTGLEGRLVDKQFSEVNWGVVPDLEITMSPDQIEQTLSLRLEADRLPGDPAMPSADGSQSEDTAKERPDIDALIERGLDSQLELAVLLLQARCLSGATEGTEQANLQLD
ncbi:MAG: S41 family peptidase [Phycisphaerales bacterium]|nr:S41 family peptidase [Phycisphaerales bacterium]